MVFLLKKISSSTGFTKKAVAEVAAAMTSIHTIAKNRRNLFSLIRARIRLCLSLKTGFDIFFKIAISLKRIDDPDFLVS